jgi:indole-3-glycerol phosphate synthase
VRAPAQGPPTVLAGILESTRATLVERKRVLPPAELAAEAASTAATPRFRAALVAPPIAAIAEFKRRSPSAGALLPDPSTSDREDVRAIAGAYERGGARAISVLTEEPNFNGSLEDLRVARAACELPIIRKDFVIDPYQLHEAVLAGADAVLLIVAALPAALLGELHGQAQALGLDVLVEVHDEDELGIALEVGAALIGVNNRDLRDFSVDLGRTARLMSAMPRSVTVVSESGISGRPELERLESEGVAAVLVGESLMRSRDPELALDELLGRDRTGVPAPGQSF